MRLSASHDPSSAAGGRLSALPAVVEDYPANKASDEPTFQQMTNSSLVKQPPTPRRGVFSKPLTSPSSIPTPVRMTSLAAAGSTIAEAVANPVVAVRPKALPGRKPRISRSRVIARLASQRAASTSATSAGVAGSSGSRTRSSLGAGVGKRPSYGGSKGGRGSAGGNVLMSAKKRARQSEYVRRRSRAAAGSAVGGLERSRDSGSMAMDVSG